MYACYSKNKTILLTKIPSEIWSITSVSLILQIPRKFVQHYFYINLYLYDTRATAELRQIYSKLHKGFSICDLFFQRLTLNSLSIFQIHTLCRVLGKIFWNQYRLKYCSILSISRFSCMQQIWLLFFAHYENSPTLIFTLRESNFTKKFGVRLFLCKSFVDRGFS